MRLSIVARATRYDDPMQEKFVRVPTGRRYQTVYDGASIRWSIERLAVEEAAHAIAGLQFRSLVGSGEPWDGIYV